MAKDINTAVAQVMQEVGYVQKQKVKELSYSYAGEAALIQAIRPALVQNGVFMYVKDVLNKNRIQYTTAKGTLMFNTILDAVIRFVHAESGTFIDVMSSGEGMDSGDKSQNKAMTGAYKYALRQTFCIETGDDPDKEASVEIAKERVWSLDQMDGLLEVSVGFADSHEGAKEILALSVLPENAPVKTVQSWFNHFKNAEGDNIVRAAVANDAYMKAKKGGK